MILHHKKKDFINAIATASQKLGIREVYIEKDYWVTYVLKSLSTSEYTNKVVFKGGTSLSKAHQLIERFSEDVDLALLLDGTETGGQVKALIKNIEAKLMSSPFEENKAHPVKSKGSKFRKTAHVYPRLIQSNDFGYAYDHLVLEINSFANPTPYKRMKISSIIAQFIQSIDKKMITEYELQDFEVNVLDIKRTFTEKLMGLVRAGYEANPLISLEERIRHIYDLHQLLATEEIKTFLDDGLKSMIEVVREDDRKNIEFQGAWMEKKMADSLLFKKTNEVMQNLTAHYQDNFSSLVYGELPPVSDLVTTIKKIAGKI
jgi:predicted nucleotidyltransferase component of viral defense system